MASQSAQIVDVALAALVRESFDAGPRVLIARRPAGKVYAGYWELPGGKCEPGETPAQCLLRELVEEIGLHVTPRQPLRVVEHVYDHAHVRLHPWLCEADHPDAAHPHEAAELRWVCPRTLADYPFPEANQPILDQISAILTSPEPLDS